MYKFSAENFIKQFLDDWLWKEVQEGGRRKAKWDGNGSVRDLRRKRERGSWSEVDSLVDGSS